MTRRMKEVLGVTQVADRKDIFEKYNQLMENAARKPNAFRQSDNHEGKEQIEADQIGLFALTAAGYDPQAHARLFDRFAETKGKTGGFFSDLFGVTKPEAKRLREMIKGLAALPPGCVETRAAKQNEEYQRWQSAVVSYTGLGRKEALHGVIAKTMLEPPLRGEITHLRFSPDGKYVLAQDDAGIKRADGKSVPVRSSGLTPWKRMKRCSRRIRKTSRLIRPTCVSKSGASPTRS